MINLNNPAHPGHANHLISTGGRRAQRVWHPDIPLYESTVERLLEEWDENPTEVCGFIDSEQDVWIIPNVHQSPFANFLMDKKPMETVLGHIYTVMGKSVIGIFHTHPNSLPWPSPRDIVGWPNPKIGWRYFIVTKDEVLEWELVDD